MAAKFDYILLSAGKSKKRGSVTLSGSGPTESALIFQSSSVKVPTPAPININLSDVAFLHWMEVGRVSMEGGPVCVVKLGLAGNSFVRLAGFQPSDYNALKAWLTAAGKELHVEKVSTKGANYGIIKVDNHRFTFLDRDEYTIFDLPLSNINQAVAGGKNEIAIEFPQDDDPKSLAAQMETLCEIRVFVPNDEHEAELAAQAAEKAAAKARGDPAVKVEGDEEKEGGEGEDEEEDDGEPDTAAQLLVKDIMTRTGADDHAVQPLAKFNLMFQSPRGRYSVDLYDQHLKLSSKTFQYKIWYKFIVKMFLFNCVQENRHFFVIGLNPPVRQGRTASYPYMLVQFDSNEEMEESFNVDEQTCMDKYKNIMQPTMSGMAHDVVTRVFKALTEKKVLIPGDGFQSRGGGACIRCNYKANDGYLYVMEKSFFFVKKPLMHIRHAEIKTASFERVSNSATSGSKSFDLRIETVTETYIFSSIQRDEYEGLFSFLRNKRSFEIQSDASAAALTKGATGRVRAATNYDEELDPGMQRAQAEADEDSEDDEDFEGGSTSESSESGSDIAREASDSEDEAAPVKKRKKAARNDSSDDEDAPKKGTKRKRGGEDKPKRKVTRSAYFFFLDEMRPKFVAEHPELKGEMIKVTQQLAAQWKALDAEGRRKYDDLADAAKANAGDDDDDDDASKKSKKPKAPRVSKGGPKKPPTAQTLWQNEVGKKALKAAQPDLTGAEVKKQLSEQWKEMTPDEQQVYVEKVLVLKRQYADALEVWKQTHPSDGAGGDADAEDGGEEDADERKKRKKEKKKSKKNKKEKKHKKEKKRDKKNKEDASDASGDDDPAVKAEPMDTE